VGHHNVLKRLKNHCSKVQGSPWKEKKKRKRRNKGVENLDCKTDLLLSLSLSLSYLSVLNFFLLSPVLKVAVLNSQLMRALS
jgi:hypothetical protein